MESQVRILVVDDDLHSLRLTSHLLTQAGYEVIEAATGKKGLRLASEHKPDLILLDVVLPDLSGQEVCRRIKADPGLEGVFVVMFSATEIESDSQARGLEAGADGYIVRPIPNREFLARVRTLLRLQQAEAAAYEQARALRESEATYRNLVERANDGIALIQDGVVQYANPRLVAMWGGALEGVVGTPLVNYVHPDALPEVTHRYQRRVAGEDEPSVYETAMLRKDGHRLDVEVNAGLVDYQGRPADLVIIRDITERKRADEALRQSEERLRSTLSSLSDLIFVLDQDGVFIEHHQPAGSPDLYIPPEAFLGRSFRDVLPPHIVEPLAEALEALAETGETQQIDYPLTIAGQEMWFNTKLSAYRDSAGRFAGATAIARNITQRKEAEDEIRRQRDVIERIMDTSPVGITVFDREGRITFANALVQEMMARTGGKALIGRSYRDPLWSILAEDGSPLPYEQFPFAQVMRTGQRVYGVRQAIGLPDGQRVYLLANAAPLFDEEGNVESVMVTVEDITERVSAEEQIQASLREKTVLLQEVHHRVKNNLQVISSLLDMQALQTRDPRTLQVLRDSQTRIRAMAFVHDQLYRSPDLASVELSDYVQNLVTYLFGVYASKSAGVAVKIQIEDVILGLDVAIPCGLIINELASNALNYAFPTTRTYGGEIRIEMRRQDTGQLVLTVSDDGVGLPPEIDLETVPSLGLRLVSMLVQQIGGTIELDRTAGTRYTIMFAAEPGPTAAVES
jgi:PAS domain S-box-containing protein